MMKPKLIINNINGNKNLNVFFSKDELQTILNLYSKMVSSGIWKDYSFTFNSKEIHFDIYHRSSDRPYLKIQKDLKPKYENEKFTVIDKNGLILSRSYNLQKLLSNFRYQKLKIVK